MATLHGRLSVTQRASKQAQGADHSGGLAECRICREEDHCKHLMSPCDCSGSCKYIHLQCLTLSIESRNTDTCSICLARFKGIETYTSRRTFFEFVTLEPALRNELIFLVVLLVAMQASILLHYFQVGSVAFLFLHSLVLACFMLIYSTYLYLYYLDWVPDNLRVRVVIKHVPE